MAEAVAAAYAVETAVEGTAAAVVAASGSTVPLHAHFQRIEPSSIPQAKNLLQDITQYDASNKIYTVIDTNSSKSTKGVPQPRSLPSLAESPLPPPISTLKGHGPSLDAHGTVFLHGGYDENGKALHDTWTFDRGTGIWHKFPTIVEEALIESTHPGQIMYSESKLWYANASTVMYLEFAERDPDHNEPASQNPDTLSTGRVGSGQWQVVYPPVEADPAVNQEKQVNLPEGLQNGPTKCLLPITTGAGRQYIVSMLQTNPQNMHIFQIPSSPKTATALKDAVRDRASQAIPSLPDSWKSGKFEWSKVEIIESSMQEGEIDRPAEETTEYQAQSWTDNDKIVIWLDDADKGWVVTFD